MDQQKIRQVNATLVKLELWLEGTFKIVLQLLMYLMAGLLLRQIVRYEFLRDKPTDTAAIKLTADEVSALRNC